MSADLLARLIEAGTPAALVAEVAMLSARADAAGEAIEGRRAKDRERQDRRRHAMSRDITLDSVTTRDVTDEPAPAPSSSPDPSNNPTPTRKGTPARTRGGAAWPCPAGVDAEHWSDFLANRKSKRLGYTATALAGVVRDLAKFSDDEWPPGRIVQHAAERGWGAIFDPRPRDTRNGQRPHHDRSEPQNPMVRAVQRSEARAAGRDGAGFQPHLLT